MPDLKVLHWQLSGVAWVPWRVARLVAECAQHAIQVIRAAPVHGLESYGLPEVDFVSPTLIHAIERADPQILHLHHAYVAEDMIDLVRQVFPELKIVVTLHGEPDRSRGPLRGPTPDAYHVVEPGLANLVLHRMVPVEFIPNHPATEPTRMRMLEDGVLVPFSHVDQFKDHDRLEELDARRLHRMQGRASNDALRHAIARHSATWVQFQGYFDLLTMEAWQEGRVAIVGPPDPALLPAWSAALGFTPQTAFRRERGHLLAELRAALGSDSVSQHNARGMAACWTMAQAGKRWVEFYRGVA